MEAVFLFYAISLDGLQSRCPEAVLTNYRLVTRGALAVMAATSGLR